MKSINDEFYIISLLSAYLLVKDKYNTLDEDLIKSNKEDNKDIILSKLGEVDKFNAVTNKKKIVDKAYQDLVDRIESNDIDENDFFLFIKNEVQELSEKDKEYLLNVVIYLAHHNKRISNSEKETIVHAAHFIGLDSDFKEIIKRYEKSEFIKKPSFVLFLAPVALVLIISFLGVYFYSNSNNNELNFDNATSVVFNEVSFNRMVVYKNKYNVRNDYLLKQAIFYLYGTAEVSFNPDNLTYDPRMKKIILSYEGDSIFDIELNSDYRLVDRLDPLPISREDALKISAVVGVAGAAVGGVTGNKLGNMIGSVLPGNASIVSGLIGTFGGIAIGGAATSYLAFRTLDGLEINEGMGRREEQEVVSNADKLIKALLMADSDLENIYKENFENYITEIFKARGLEINSFEYKGIE